MGKGRRIDRGSSDELAPVKAAAWAWYEHGSGSSDRKPNLREFHYTKTQTTCRPSRFKVEAMMMMRIKMSTPSKQKIRSSENNNASRIDSYEQINRSGSPPQLARKGSVVAANIISKKSNELKRLWLWRSRVSIMCGIGKDHHRDVVGGATVFRNNGITANSIKSCVSIQ